ncbi:type I-F CRISPR-associated endoribonuclease Cas6/Csy4 [Jinshanibacter sp. LJY008]|uniref:Type I-F CRISPR-associated endoribonuclease Cas6/Csy4 n=1 Tax=Limnobaculum eriocheiris TaxID=2897391 RepID=A0A9X1MVD1_9GAMM|nr:type I-F CRISPR-associated endoribonuclease Cas6/Csy4 [Limnobaculum eriocheiris]MCD1126346.1 type I-F CRISPR-associated endoribonuclease Cas6/Csy4 [Limnobaculum eriocheiris]
MDRYIDIQILPNPEIATPLVMNQLFYQLHLKLVDSGVPVGVSFPCYCFDSENHRNTTLGPILRLHGTEQDLSQLELTGTVSSLFGYVLISQITPVPAVVKGYALFARKHAKTERDIERKRQFLLKKAGGNWNEIAQKNLQSFINKLRCQLPFIHLVSHSSKYDDEKNHFHLFISREESRELKGTLTKYGLSDPVAKASVPIF